VGAETPGRVLVAPERCTGVWWGCEAGLSRGAK